MSRLPFALALLTLVNSLISAIVTVASVTGASDVGPPVPPGAEHAERAMALTTSPAPATRARLRHVCADTVFLLCRDQMRNALTDEAVSEPADTRNPKYVGAPDPNHSTKRYIPLTQSERHVAI